MRCSVFTPHTPTSDTFSHHPRTIRTAGIVRANRSVAPLRLCCQVTNLGRMALEVMGPLFHMLAPLVRALGCATLLGLYVLWLSAGAFMNTCVSVRRWWARRSTVTDQAQGGESAGVRGTTAFMNTRFSVRRWWATRSTVTSQAQGGDSAGVRGSTDEPTSREPEDALPEETSSALVAAPELANEPAATRSAGDILVATIAGKPLGTVSDVRMMLFPKSARHFIFCGCAQQLIYYIQWFSGGSISSSTYYHHATRFYSIICPSLW